MDEIRVGFYLPTMIRGGAEMWTRQISACLRPPLKVCRHIVGYWYRYDDVYAEEFATIAPVTTMFNEWKQPDAFLAGFRKYTKDLDVIVGWGIEGVLPDPDTQSRLILGVHDTLPKTIEPHARRHIVTVGRRCRVADAAVELIYNAADAQRFLNSGARRGAREAYKCEDGSDWSRPETRLIVSVCRLVTAKAQHQMIHAVAQLPDNYQLKIVGWGDRAEEIRQLGENMLGSRFELLPSNTNLPELFAAADAFIQLSTQECFSIALLEAAAAGLPIVTTASGGVPEMQARFGPLFWTLPEQTTAQAAAEALLAAVRAGRSDPRVHRARAAVFQHFDKHAFSRRWNTFIRKVAGC